MRAASTGGGLVRFVAIRLVVLAVLVMTAAGASTTSAATIPATVTATATVTAATAAAAAARKFDAAGSQSTATPSSSSAAAGTRGPSAAGNVTACEPVRVSTRKPACTGQITEGPGPPRPLSSSSSLPTPPSPSSRCPAPVPCADSSDNNNNNNKINNINNNYNNNNNTSNHQCLVYARRELIPTMCPDDRSAYLQTGRLERYRLRHCCHHTVESVVQRPYADRESCVDQVESALHMDDVAAAMSCQFDGVLARYDCKQKYSAKSCESCKDAYARWACAAVLPHWTRTASRARTVDDGRPIADDGTDGRDGAGTAARGRRYRVKACRSVCLDAEQTCPWLLPVADDTNPYAGEAAFTCMDPDIGYQMSATDTTEQCCYEHCADQLCVRNASACHSGGGGGGGGGGSDQRPVCVEDVKLLDDGPDEKCDDYSLTDDVSGGARPTAPCRTVALLLLLLQLLSALTPVTILPAFTATAVT